MRKAQLGAMLALSAFRELRGPHAFGTIVVDGAPALVPLLARELREGGNPGVVREGGSLAGAAVLVWVGEPDEAKLRAASRARVPIVAVTEAESVPYVLATDVVHVPPGAGFPLPRIAAAIARRAAGSASALAAELPVLRDAIVAELIRTASRRNAVLAAAIFIPGADFPVLTLNQVRLVARIASAHGRQLDRARGLELAGVVGAGFGFRALARASLQFVPVGGFAVKSAVAYGGTRAVGEAARRYFAEIA